ncbi:1-phosphofructokinase family hexose kinase [Tomitella biformata]|uniref:1-phosphofructokinase family hexose kinase n=1 Tax=Tomitella biformata TaxID=630403 RepID=UPI000464AF6E|nr:1-phosphofructokinase [Tomitella biformata]
MIITLTANPSLDRTITLPGPLQRGGVLRSTGTRVDPGGKGVNVARVAHAAGAAVTAILPADAGDPLLAALARTGTPSRPVERGAPARTNLTLAEPDGTTTKINDAGSAVSDQVLARLLAEVIAAAAGADWVVMSGSLPPGTDDSWYAAAVLALRALPCKIAVDTSDGPLLGLAAGFGRAAPHLIKPNAEELAQLTGLDPEGLEAAAARGDLGPVVEAGLLLRGRGVERALITLGGAGALLVAPEGAYWGKAPPVAVRSTVGAGDSSLAGYLLAEVQGLAPAECLRTAIAYGTAAVTLPGTELPTPQQVTPLREATTVTALDIRHVETRNRP